MKTKTRTRGFTLVEILVVLMIVTLLATFLIAGLWPQQEKAYRAATQALIGSIQTALDQYYAEFHDYPPDGYDMEPGWGAACTGAGIKLGTTPRTYMGSGCLVYFLCHPVANVTMRGADGAIDVRDVQTRIVGPFLKLGKSENLSVWWWDNTFDLAIDPGSTQFKAGWEVCELVDSYGWPIFYDKVHDSADPVYFQPDRFTGSSSGKGNLAHSDQTYFTTFVTGRFNTGDNVCPQGNGEAVGGGSSTSSHDQYTGGTTSASGPPPVDPRCSQPEADGCIVNSTASKFAPVPRNVNGYDLWSCGRSFTNGRYNINNWQK